MQRQTFIFIGASGSGKGTQVKLLMDFLRMKDPETAIFYLQTGQAFREFIKSDNFAASIAREAMANGERLPDFLAMWLWSDIFVKNLKGKERLIIDGSPRSIGEAKNLDFAMKFFKRQQPVVIHLDVSQKWSEEHLLARAKAEGRSDDNIESIRKRLSWYEHDVVPAINRYRRDRDYDFIEIDGERSVEEVHRDLLERLGYAPPFPIYSPA
jgi:adenylate kinase